MADLENMLLEAAGRTSSPVRKRHKSRNSKSKREGGAAFSDGGSHSREEDSDEGANKKPQRYSSHVPLKKRLDVSRRSSNNSIRNEHGGGDLEDGAPDRDGGSSEESDVGSDLYKNEDDKQKLANMTELEREMILSNRATKKCEKEFKEKMRSKRENKNASAKTGSAANSSHHPSSAKVRSSARNAERTASKGDVLSELRAKRMKQQTVDPHDKLGKASGSGSSSKQKPGATASPSSSSQSESVIRSDSERDSSDDGGLGDSDDDKNIHESRMPSFENIREITIRRSKLVKWLNEPFFEELIVGCFVRIGIGKSESGPVYRLCTVQRVDGGDPNKHYKVENRVTHKYLVCVWGSENSAKKFQVAVVSDSAPLEREFRQWVREVERTCSQMPSKMSVLEKKEAIKRTSAYVYSAATVKQMLEEKKSAPSRPLNIAVEKDRMKNLLEVAKCKNDEAEVDRILRKLADLEACRKSRETDTKALRLAEMNRKNKVENFKNLSEHKLSNANLKAGEEGYDPFSRRWTRSRNYYGKDTEKNEEKGEKDGEVSKEEEKEETGVTTKVGVEVTELALQAAANEGKLIDTNAPVDGGTESNMLHDFDLPISLSELKNFGGPQGLKNGFLARKQKIEATVGCRVSDNDGSRHALTLTISDYKRRRGLL
ncbi:protein RTF1 homolog [Vigna unguiculata]|uniref:RNA polymerase-associated protein RTF1 n=1 Tax=Vigna unguiculata TaxID=3917 RepID=A0A4D6MDI4_VIGUN|nr:protein RTF1 homolog [Vigna unguiculata]QCD98408.1 RNA polymerase-associated protein RTF1 [Vigna unguiculata]